MNFMIFRGDNKLFNRVRRRENRACVATTPPLIRLEFGREIVFARISVTHSVERLIPLVMARRR